MALMDSLKEFYSKMEEKYYAFLDTIESRGVPVYKIVDAIEAQNIPSFPVALLFLVAVLVLVFLGISAVFFASGTLEVTVQDSGGIGIEGASVTAILDNKTLAEKRTDFDGKATIDVPLGKEIDLSISRSGFVTKESSYTATEVAGKKIITMQAQIQTFQKTINVMENGTTRLLQSYIEVQFSCTGNGSFGETKSTVNGIIQLDVPSDCDSLVSTTYGDYSISNEAIFLSSADRVDLFVEKDVLVTGSVVVAISDNSGAPIPGVDVSLYMPTESNTPGSIFQTKQASASGTVPFDDVPIGRYYIVVYDRQGNFSEYDGLLEKVIQEVSKDRITNFTVVLKENVAGKIRLQIQDLKSTESIEGASVKLSKNETELATIQTDSEGKVEFNVGEDIEYNLLIDKHGYLIKSVKLKPSTDYKISGIEEATIENSQSLLVKVVDETGQPVENVRLKLRKNSDGVQFGSELVTGLDGKAIFERVEEGLYYVYAVKPGFGEKNSDTVSLSSRQKNELQLTLPIGFGRVEATVIDESGAPVVGAVVKAVDSATFSTIDEQSTDSDGKKVISVRADKEIFLAVSANGFVQSISTPEKLQRDATTKKTIVLEKAVQKFSIDLEGIYLDNELVSETGTAALNTGQKYTAKFKLRIPAGSAFDEAGAHIRTGAEESTAIEKDNLYITDVRGAFNSITRATSYTSPQGQATDAQHITAGNAKWANITFKNPGPGVYDIEADVQVRDEARIGALLDVWYRAWGKSGGYIRDPVDVVLGNGETSADKQGLYAQASKRTFSVGPSSLCGDDFCSKFSIQNMRTGITSGIVETYSGQVSNSYKLSFELSSISETPFSATMFGIKDKTSSFAIKSYKIKTPSGETRENQGVGSEIEVALGEIGKDGVVSGEIIFEAKKEGSIPLEVSIISGTESGIEVYNKTISVKILPAENLSVDVLPTVIVPLINNNLLVKVADENSGNAISNAKVSIKNNGIVIANGETDIEGVFAYTLLSPADGSTIGVHVERIGYRPVEKELKVTGNIIDAQPKTIKLAIAVGGTAFKTIDAVLLNHSQIPLDVESVSLSRDFTKYIEWSFDEPTQGTTIDIDSNTLLKGTFRLTPEGRSISEPVKILGSVNVLVTNAAFEKKWLASIPFELSIGFGDGLDDTDCLTLFPSEWNIFSSGSNTEKLKVTLVNNCQVSGEPISLKNLSARVNLGNANAVGQFRLSSSVDGAKPLELTNAFKKFADNLSEEAEESIDLEFLPGSIISGSSDVKIEVKAVHLTQNSEEALVKKIDAKIRVNNLNDCVEILTQGDLTISSCPSNTGHGNYGDRFSSYNDSRYGAYDPYAQNNGYGTGLPPYLSSDQANNGVAGDSYYDYAGSAYPNASYNQPFMGTGVNSAYSNSWNCGAGEVVVRNSCESPVDLSFQAQPGITTRDRTLTIEPGEEDAVFVEPTNFFGRYSLKINAKPSESKAKSTEIGTVYVNVTNEAIKDYTDCISISPAKTFNFNNFFGKPVELKVINTCVNDGVFLQPSNNTINFTGDRVANPADQSAGFRELIESWSIAGQPQYSSSPNGQVTQTLTFEIVKAVKQYRNQAPKVNLLTENPFADVGNLRYFLSSGYYAVFGRANLYVNFVAPSGQQRSITFPMEVTDYWPLLEYGEELSEEFSSFGDPNLKPADCLNLDALNFTRIAGGADLPWDRVYSTSLNDSLFKFGKKDPKSGKEVGGCGTGDKITNVEPGVYNDPNTGLIMEVFQDGKHEIGVQFNPDKWNGKRATIVAPIFIDVTRANPAGHGISGGAIRINVGEDKEYQTGTGTGTGTGSGSGDLLCENGSAGANIYQALGFQHLKYEWRILNDADKGVIKNACDVYNSGLERIALSSDDAPWFCDATQATIEFARKIAEQQKVIDGINASTGGAGSCLGSACTAGTLSSKDLHKYTLAQKQATDNDSYFLNSAGDGVIDLDLPIDLSGLKNKTDVIKDITNPDDPKQATRINNETTAVIAKILEETAKPEYKGAEVVLEIKDWSYSATGTVQKPTEVGGKDLGGNWYVLPLTTYRDNVFNPCKDATGATCTTTAGKTISVEFLEQLGKGNWKLTAKNLNDLAPKVKDEVMKKGQWVTGLSSVDGYSNFDEFYKKNVSIDMYLVKDSYKKGLIAEFVKIEDYQDLLKDLKVNSIITKDKVEFSDKAISEAGEYNVVLEYQWNTATPSANKIAVAFSRNKTLKEIDSMNKENGFESNYADNVLFSTPIDGSVNWGTSFTGAPASTFYFNNYDISKLADAKELPQATEKKTAETKYTFDYKKDYADVKAGKVLSISSSTFDYAPSDPILVQVDLSNSTMNGTTGFIYEYRINKDKVADPLGWTLPDKDDIGYNWQFAFAGQVDGSRLERTLSQQYDGFMLDNSKKGKIIFQTLILTPAYITTGRLNGSEFELVRAVPQGNATSTYGFDDSENSTVTRRGTLNLNDGLGLQFVTEYNLKSMLDKINDGTVCADASNNTLDLYWNKEKIIENVS